MEYFNLKEKKVLYQTNTFMATPLSRLTPWKSCRFDR